jgi:hypothetical protein
MKAMGKILGALIAASLPDGALEQFMGYIL